MDKTYLEAANSVGMWLAVLPMIAVMLFQAVLFMIKAYRTGYSMGLTKKKLQRGIRVGAVTAMGPSFSLLVGLAALITLIGAPMAWMRINSIGGVVFATLASNNGAEVMGVELGGPDYDLPALSSSIWVLCLGSLGWMASAAVFTHRMEAVRARIVQGREYMLPVLSIGGILGAFAFHVSKYLAEFGPATVAALTSGITMIIVIKISNSYKIGWLKEWALGVAMLTGMFTAALV